MSASAQLSVTKRDRPLGICPRCRAVIRAFDQLGKKCAAPLSLGGRFLKRSVRGFSAAGTRRL